MRRFIYWGILGVMALAAAGVAYQWSNYLPAAKLSADAAVTPVEKVVTVEAEKVAVDTVLGTIRAVGTLRPNEAVVIAPEIAGRIAKIPFSEGEQVKAGDVLVELDSSILRAELAKARSSLTLAEANRERALTLAKQGTGTLRARDESEAEYQRAQSDLALAEARLAKTAITAPFPGVVGVRAVSVGAYVVPGDRIVELADINPIKLDFRVPELALSSLRAGQAIQVTVDAFPGRTFEGKVYVIDPIVDANGRAVRLRARIQNPDGTLSPGLFARVQIVVERRENAILIPESAVFADGQTRYVYRVIDGRAVQTKIEVGQRRPGQVEIVGGLGTEDIVVTAGHQQIRDGGRVSVVNAGPKV